MVFHTIQPARQERLNKGLGIFYFFHKKKSKSRSE